MNPVLETILNRPASHKIGIWVASIGLVGFLFWQYVYSAAATERGELTEKVDSLQTQIAHERRLVRNKDKIMKEVEELDVKLKFALQELPDEREIPDLLSSISNLARDAGLEVNLFRPRGEVRREFYAEVPVAITVEGTFHQVATFFDDVGQLSRVVNIDQITMGKPAIKGENVIVNSSCVATTFRYLDEDERIGSEDEAGRRRRRG